jgi:hypothetical protein
LPDEPASDGELCAQRAAFLVRKKSLKTWAPRRSPGYRRPIEPPVEPIALAAAWCPVKSMFTFRILAVVLVAVKKMQRSLKPSKKTTDQKES